jgi:hypothetical protein
MSLKSAEVGHVGQTISNANDARDGESEATSPRVNCVAFLGMEKQMFNQALDLQPVGKLFAMIATMDVGL